MKELMNYKLLGSFGILVFRVKNLWKGTTMLVRLFFLFFVFLLDHMVHMKLLFVELIYIQIKTKQSEQTIYCSLSLSQNTKLLNDLRSFMTSVKVAWGEQIFFEN